MNTVDNQLQAAVQAAGFRFTLQGNYIVIHSRHGAWQHLVGIRIIGDFIASAFVLPAGMTTGPARRVKELADCLNRCMPVGAWSCDESPPRLRYRCRLPIPADANKRGRFFGSFVRRQMQLIGASIDVIARAGAEQDPRQAAAMVMTQLRPMTESLPPEERVTAAQWERAMKALRIDEAPAADCQRY